MLNENDEVKVSKPLVINSKLSVSEAIVIASDFVGESIPVVDGSNTLLGVITEADLFSAYLNVQSEITEIEKD